MPSDQEPESPPPPDALSWERKVSRPPELNDQTATLPFWMRPFAKPNVERRAASWPMSLVLARVGTPYAFIVALAVNAMLGVPMRHMLFAVPATTLIGSLLLLVAFGGLELVGWASGYRKARVSWTLADDDAPAVLAAALTKSVQAHGFAIVWSKDNTFVATRNVHQQAVSFATGSIERVALRLSLLEPRQRARERVLKIGVHAICFWEAGETAMFAALARDIVNGAAIDEPWIARIARLAVMQAQPELRKD
jgi:hypothetical protein